MRVLLVDEHTFENMLRLGDNPLQFIAFEGNRGYFILNKPFVDIILGFTPQNFHACIHDQRMAAK